MYDLSNISIITYACRFAVINETYRRGTQNYIIQHITSLINFLNAEYVCDDNDKNDLEAYCLLSNLLTWISSIKNLDNKEKITLKLPDTITKSKWSNQELNIFSEHIKCSIKNKGLLWFKHKELENPLGLVEWIINMMLQKYQDPNLKRLLLDFQKHVHL